MVSQWWILGGGKEELTTCTWNKYVIGQRFIPKPELCRRNIGHSQLRKANYFQTSSVKVESTSTKNRHDIQQTSSVIALLIHE